MPFKSKKQKVYLAINEPDVYKKFKKEEQNRYGKPMKKKMEKMFPRGVVGGAAPKKNDFSPKKLTYYTIYI